ncbi:MAG: EBSC protein [Clostridiales bacterium]|nr:MAG: EBSC protein [Clostridiales bacterium]
MALEKVKKYLKKFGLDEKIQEFEVSSATVELAAKALCTDENRIAKTLSFLVENKPILIVCAGDTRIDNKKFKSEFSTKANMIARENVEEMVGYKVGGVCPFGVNQNVLIYLDESLKRFETVFPACGTSNSAIELSIYELEKVVEFTKWIDVCKY